MIYDPDDTVINSEPKRIDFTPVALTESQCLFFINGLIIAFTTIFLMIAMNMAGY